jgi:hypothetical protein
MESSISTKDEGKGAATADATNLQEDLIPIDTLDPMTIFKRFIQEIDLTILEKGGGLVRIMNNSSSPAEKKQESVSNAEVTTLNNQIIQAGIAEIEKVYDNYTTKGENRHIHHQRMNLELNNITLQNFGPYGNKKIQYPLSKRGLVLIKGKLLDGTGADSNGSGKTTLAMSVLWCLTGSMDTRLIADGRSHDVTNDASSSASSKAATEVKFDDVQASGSSSKKVAEVTLEGIINEKPFQIIRRKGARKQELFFILDGVDQTTQSIKDTQQKIDEILGIGTGLLQRCYFFGQHSHTSQVRLNYLHPLSPSFIDLIDLL